MRRSFNLDGDIRSGASRAGPGRVEQPALDLVCADVLPEPLALLGGPADHEAVGNMRLIHTMSDCFGRPLVGTRTARRRSTEAPFRRTG